MVLKHLILKCNYSQREFAKKVHMSEQMLSRFCNYVCLPIPKDLSKICNALECDTLDIYNRQEIEFLKKDKKRTHEDIDFYRFTVTLNKEAYELLNASMLKRLGFSSQKELMEKLVLEKLAKKKAKLEKRSNMAQSCI